MINVTKETLKKVTGDISDEGPEAIIRVTAATLVTRVNENIIDKLGDDNAIKKVLRTDEKVAETILGFTLAAALEFFPMPKLDHFDDIRQRLAYNLRVRSLERLGEFIISFTPLIPLIESETQRSIRLAKRLAKPVLIGDPKRRGSSPPKSSKGAGGTMPPVEEPLTNKSARSDPKPAPTPENDERMESPPYAEAPVPTGDQGSAS